MPPLPIYLCICKGAGHLWCDLTISIKGQIKHGLYSQACLTIGCYINVPCLSVIRVISLEIRITISSQIYIPNGQLINWGYLATLAALYQTMVSDSQYHLRIWEHTVILGSSKFQAHLDPYPDPDHKKYIRLKIVKIRAGFALLRTGCQMVTKVVAGCHPTLYMEELEV